MARELDSTFAAELEESLVRPVKLFDIELSTLTLRLCTWNADLTFQSESYLGNGWLSGWSPIQEGAGRAKGMSVELTGVPSAVISAALAHGNALAAANFHVGMLDASGAFVGTPYTLFKGGLDVIEIDDDPREPTVEFNIVPKFSTVQRKELRYTDAYQQYAYPGDRGFEYVVSLQNKNIIWGRRGRDA